MMTISVKPTRHQGTQCGVQGTPGGAPADSAAAGMLRGGH